MQIEIAGGAIGAACLGVNPGELIDFIPGWSTVDIYHFFRFWKSRRSGSGTFSFGTTWKAASSGQGALHLPAEKLVDWTVADADGGCGCPLFCA
ncbi:MAG: hypothetical protein MUC65_03665 [Pontiellaceae bacterium]|jgi:hypothetical protein|nr:hypothetical protein [Pontiellaceae bacterium]